METRWDRTQGIGPTSYPSKAVTDRSTEQERSGFQGAARTADLTLRSPDHFTSVDLESRLKELASGNRSVAPQPFNVNSFKVGVESWRPAITPLPTNDVKQNNVVDFNSNEFGDPALNKPEILPPIFDHDQETSSEPSGNDVREAKPTWVRRGGKDAVATAFLKGVSRAAAGLPPTTADADRNAVSLDSERSDRPQRKTAATTPRPRYVGQNHPVKSREPAPATRHQISPTNRQLPVTLTPSALEGADVPTLDKQPSKKIARPPQKTPFQSMAVQVVTPVACAADVFAADLQVRVSRVVANNAATKAKQALSVARNESSSANAIVEAAKSDRSEQADVEAATAIANANTAASLAQAAHYDAETKIRALEIARTALAALTRTSPVVTLPSNPTEADLAIAKARAAILESTEAAEVAIDAAVEANKKVRAARRAPTDSNLAEEAIRASVLARQKQQAAHNCEARAEAAVSEARKLTI